MNPEIKKAWVDALRSGNYKQGDDEVLREEHADGPAYCCLGVLAELNGRLELSSEDRDTWILTGTDGFHESEFTMDTMEDFNLTHEACHHLMAMNDGRLCRSPGTSEGDIGYYPSVERKSFEEIADWIEERL